MKKIYLLSLFSWSFLLFVIFCGGSEAAKNFNHKNFPYLIKKDYVDYDDLIQTGLENVDANNLFNYCCDVINFLGCDFGYTYTEMNLIIFVFFGPLFIINLILIVVLQGFYIKKLSGSIGKLNRN
jgi:hypothetical protein